MKYGPLSTHLYAFDDLDIYKDGIYKHVKQPNDKPEENAHAVLIVGWGFD